MAFQNSGVQVTCKQCGKPSMSSEFVLDPVFKMMVCKNCVAARKLKENPIRSTTENSSFAKPVKVTTVSSLKPGSSPPPKQPAPSAAKVLASGDKIRKKCPKCKFGFTYDAAKQYPQNCPNCGTATNSGYSFF